MTGFGLEEEEEVGILLDFSVVGEMTFFWINVFEVPFDLVLLETLVSNDRSRDRGQLLGLTSSRAIRFWISKAIRESRKRTSRSSTKFFLDWAEMRALRSLKRFWAGKS